MYEQSDTLAAATSTLQFPITVKYIFNDKSLLLVDLQLLLLCYNSYKQKSENKYMRPVLPQTATSVLQFLQLKKRNTILTSKKWKMAKNILNRIVSAFGTLATHTL